MLSGAMESARAIVGTAVFRMVVSRAPKKNASATSQGTRRREPPGPPAAGSDAASSGLAEVGAPSGGCSRGPSVSLVAMADTCHRSCALTTALAFDEVSDSPDAGLRLRLSRRRWQPG